MEIQYFGANCLKIATKKATIVIDDNLGDVGLSSVTKSDNIAIFTGPHGETKTGANLVIDHPGEYEISDVSVRGVAARAHIDESGQKSSTIFKIIADDIKLVALGHIYPELNDDQLEAIGSVDILFVPVGGSGYTLDPIGALKVIRKIEPKIIIPTHFADKAIKYPVPQQELEQAVKDLAMEPSQTIGKLKIKASEITEEAKLIILERQ